MLARLAPLLFVLLWSTGFIGAKYGLPDAEPFAFLAIRFALAIPVLVLIGQVRGASWPGVSAAGHATFVGALIHGVYLGGVFWAIAQGLPAGIAALIVSLQPITTAVLAVPLLGEYVTWRHWLGLGIGLIGVLLVLSPGVRLAGAALEPAAVVACFVSLLALACGTLYQKRFASGIDLIPGAAWQYAGALAVAGVMAFGLEELAVNWTASFAFALIWLVLVLSVGAILLLMLLIRENAVSRIAAYFYLVPPLVAVEAWLLFGETLDALQIVGMILVAVALALVGLSAASRPRHAATRP